MLLLAVFSFLVALVSVLWVRRRFRRHAANYPADMPQRFHHGSVPRVGGVGVGLGWLAGLWLIPVLPWLGRDVAVPLTWAEALGYTAVASIVLGVGVYEDVSQRVPAHWRVVFTLLAGVAAVLLLGVQVPRLGLLGVDNLLLEWQVFGVLLALLAVAGLPHAFNLIDGYNGLAGAVTVLIALALAHVAMQVGDRQLAALSLCLAAATMGFLAWNYPSGLVFAGDGGAYLWGGVIAVISILLVQRHPEVSPWFVMLLLLYPVWETVFSSYRRWSRGRSAGVADALHLHQLVYRRLVRAMLEPDEAASLLARNNRTAPYLVSLSTFSIVPAVLFWRSTWVLVAFCLLFVAGYVGLYLMIVRFKTPAWLRR